MASLKLEPRPQSSLGLYVTTQILTKSKPPPDTTSFAGQTAIITGSNVGIGLEASRQMLARGLSHLIMGVRSLPKGEAAAASLRTSHPGAKIEVWSLDMISYDSIRNFAERCSSLARIDKVIQNASVLNVDFKICATGHEETFQVNYLSTALLAILLLPILKEQHLTGNPRRLTIVSSNAGLTNLFPNRDIVPLIPSFDNPQFWGPFMDRYATTKSLQLILTHKLSEYVKSADVVINAVDPGFVAGSSLHRSFSGCSGVIFDTLKRLTARTMEEATWTYMDAVGVKGEESHGGFLVNWEVHP
jgi:NAD(P)-dependent dehydrogenase (short-subunit alcohol dehydrogenase family)